MKKAVKWAAFGLIGVAALGFTGFYAGSGLAKMQAGYEQNELRTLLDLGHRMVGEPERVVIKWQGTWEGSAEQTEAAAQKLSRSLQLPSVTEVKENGHTTYRVIGQKDTVPVRFNWQEMPGGQSYVIIQLEASTPGQWSLLSDLQAEFGNKMREAGIDAKWNAALQGNVDDRLKAAETMERIEGKLTDCLDAVPKETYNDATTVSNAYQVPSLMSRVRSGDTWLNMQVAVHEDDESGKNRVTIGLPVITIEY
ncbi:YwmB family TATA-box binding protein [Paenibacillus sp. VCA1]|uniref:YwmB family TATA-box binding protein n=1 Tax=Paenibacillus sp. VCA1 TaxID=3039148 RepID=UPI00287266B2|nr:YwmB family TATA-box binding protein [Paenibacillus sp. VCA1]MDR9855906.1 YwmB family TATA-box binding protein [Paenibacillus sp. VCA1]